MEPINKAGKGVAKWMYWIAEAAIVAMMLLTCADVVMRSFRMPIPGTYELVCYMGAVAASFAMAYTSLEKGHVEVSFVVVLLPEKVQGWIESITNFISIVFFSLLSWRSIVYALKLQQGGEVSPTIQLPFYPFVLGVGFSAAAVCLVLIVDLCANLKRVAGK